jgi:hypothetical protein
MHLAVFLLLCGASFGQREVIRPLHNAAQMTDLHALSIFIPVLRCKETFIVHAKSLQRYVSQVWAVTAKSEADQQHCSWGEHTVRTKTERWEHHVYRSDFHPIDFNVLQTDCPVGIEKLTCVANEAMYFAATRSRGLRWIMFMEDDVFLIPHVLNLALARAHAESQDDVLSSAGSPIVIGWGGAPADFCKGKCTGQCIQPTRIKGPPVYAFDSREMAAQAGSHWDDIVFDILDDTGTNPAPCKQKFVGETKFEVQKYLLAGTTRCHYVYTLSVHRCISLCTDNPLCRSFTWDKQSGQCFSYGDTIHSTDASDSHLSGKSGCTSTYFSGLWLSVFSGFWILNPAALRKLKPALHNRGLATQADQPAERVAASAADLVMGKLAMTSGISQLVFGHRKLQPYGLMLEVCVSIALC